MTTTHVTLMAIVPALIGWLLVVYFDWRANLRNQRLTAPDDLRAAA